MRSRDRLLWIAIRRALLLLAPALKPVSRHAESEATRRGYATLMAIIRAIETYLELSPDQEETSPDQDNRAAV